MLNFVEEAEFDRMGAFPFSPEEGTPAAMMPDMIPEEIRMERYDRLMALQQKISLKKNQARIGTTESVLITDFNNNHQALGRSSREAPESDGEIFINCSSVIPEIGQFVSVRLTGAESYDMRGELL